MVDKERAYVGKDEWKDTGILWRIRYVATVHEDILATTMTMKVCENQQITLLDKVMNHLLCVVDSGMQYFRWRLPSTIQIASSQRTSIISINYAIWIQHWNNFEYKVLAKNFSLRYISTSEEVQGTFHHPGTN